MDWTKIFTVAKDFLGVLVIPLIMWGVHLETRLAVQSTQLEAARADLAKKVSADTLDLKMAGVADRLTALVKELEALAGVEEAVNQSQVTVGQLSTKIDAMKETIDDIKRLVSR